ncbi:MAG: T9SS type A sorting domain-containing protein [Candidatus Latescibacterota bacterium]|nr:MAG: T9SS type A sorting domain-containing protein [Candidatus Latescibacterota bacterium]
MNFRISTSVLLLVVSLVFATPASSTTWHLDPSGPLTIQDAVTSAADGDTILLAAGTYTGDGNRYVRFLGKQVVLTSVEGPEATTIDCENITKAFFFIDGEGRETVLSGVTIKNGLGNRNGGGVYINGSSPSIIGNIFDDNSARCDNPGEDDCVYGIGGAIYITGGAPLIACNRFSGNRSRGNVGGAIYSIHSNAEIVSNYFYSNYAGDCCWQWPETQDGGAVASHGGSLLFSNNVFYRNWTWRKAMALRLAHGDHTIRNCTFVDNEDGSYANVLWIVGGVVQIENSIFAYNGTTGIMIECSDGGTATLTCNDFYNNTPHAFCATDSSGNISLDPLFVDRANGDFDLLPGSPCLPDGNACDVRIGAGAPQLYDDAWPVSRDTMRVDTGTVVCASFNMVPPIEGTDVSFEVSGANPGEGSGIVDELGAVEWCYTVAAMGTDTITATANTGFAGTTYTTSAQLIRTILPTVPVFLQSYASRWVEDHVEVTWLLLDAGSDLTFDVYRREGSAGAYRGMPEPDITQVRNAFSFCDRSVHRGRTYSYRVIVLESGEVATSFETTISVPPLALALYQNLPNPFNRSTEIGFNLDKDAWVALSVYDVSGKLVQTLVSRPLIAGEHTEVWDGRDMNGNRVASGIYFYRLEVGNKSLNRKAVLLR